VAVGPLELALPTGSATDRGGAPARGRIAFRRARQCTVGEGTRCGLKVEEVAEGVPRGPSEQTAPPLGRRPLSGLHTVYYDAVRAQGMANRREMLASWSSIQKSAVVWWCTYEPTTFVH
jgi:hypothetical protein